ncbi:MAG: phosphatase PAP2 family protein [Fidelibacterota bacterium]
MKKNFTLILIIFLFNGYGVTAEFPGYTDDFKSMVGSGSENIATYYPEMAGLALVEGLLIWRGDEWLRTNFVDANNRQFKSNILDVATYPAKWYGKNTKNLLVIYGGVTAGYYLYGQAAGHNKSIETSYLLLESFVFTAGIVEFWKILLGRARPFNGLGSKKFEMLNFHEKYHSFPSGHTAMAFSLMNTIAMSSESHYVKIPAYSFAVSAGLQRIGSDVHWASDVILGGLIGYGVSAFLYNNYYEETSDDVVQPAIRFNLIIPL